MIKLVVGVGAAALIAVGAAIFLQRLDNAELRREIALLRAEVQSGGVRAGAPETVGPMETPRAAVMPDAATILDRAELAKWREDIGALRKSTQELTQFAQMAQAAAALKSMSGTESSVATKLIPADAWKNAGKATPEAAAETVLWAAVGGDVDTLSASLVFTPTARDKADAWFAGLSESTRQQYGTPEKVIALMIAKDAAALSGMQVLGQKEIAADNVAVRLRFANNDGQTKDDNFLMRRGSDGWRMVLPDSAVEKFARQLSGKK